MRHESRGRTARRFSVVRPQDVTVGAMIVAVALAVSFLVARAWVAVLAAGAAVLVFAWLSRALSLRYPSPMPAHLRWVLVHPTGDRRRLLEAVDPRQGERLLEIGPGAGHHAIEVAAALAPSGRLDVLDAQQAMLDAVADRAKRRGVSGIVGVAGNACERLPYPDACFDGAYLVGVLGELPDPEATLRELRRVVRPGGRLVIGETPVLDPDGIVRRRAVDLAEHAGFARSSVRGSSLSYFARFSTA